MPIAPAVKARKASCRRLTEDTAQHCRSLSGRPGAGKRPERRGPPPRCQQPFRNIVVLDPNTGKTLETFDMSTQDLVPSTFPIPASLLAAYPSLVQPLEYLSNRPDRIVRGEDRQIDWSCRIERPLGSESHPTAMLLSPDEKLLYVALSNADTVAVVDTETGTFRGQLSRP